jgi:hypothetical protein
MMEHLNWGYVQLGLVDRQRVEDAKDSTTP